MQTIKKKRSKRPNLSTLERVTGISRHALAKWWNEGVDLNDHKTVSDRIASKQLNGRGPQPKEDPGGEHEETHDSARTRKMRTETDQREITVSKERGELVSADSVISGGQKVGLVIRQIFLKAESELTPRVAGLSSGKDARVINDLPGESKPATGSRRLDVVARPPRRL